jgi:formylglycine-generating enzyme required for sulfatase activity
LAAELTPEAKPDQARAKTPPATTPEAKPAEPAKTAAPLVSGAAKTRASPAGSIANPRAPTAVPRPAVSPFDTAQANEHQREWAEHLGVQTKLTNSIGMTLVLIPPGEFEMGSSPEVIAREKRENARGGWQAAHIPAEGPIHRVRITKPFYLQICPVTQDTYQQVRGRNPSRFKGDSRRPVESVTWDEAAEFCRKLSHLPEETAGGRSYRLPTEAEWEHACRAGTVTRWHFGDDAKQLANYAWVSGAGGKPHPVGQLKANLWGLYDMNGNVAQWCADWYDKGYYAESPTDDPPGPAEGRDRVVRGGGWRDGPGWARSAYRLFRPHDYRVDDNLGFRVALDIPPRAVRASSGTAVPSKQP